MNKLIRLQSPFLSDVFLVYDEKWHLENNNMIYEVDTNKFEVMMMLVAYLTNEKSLYDEKISAVNKKALESFPIREIIESGFLQKTTYWVGLSIEWLNNSDGSMPQYFEKQIKDVVNNKRFTQKTRQLADKLLKSID